MASQMSGVSLRVRRARHNSSNIVGVTAARHNSSKVGGVTIHNSSLYNSHAYKIYVCKSSEMKGTNVVVDKRFQNSSIHAVILFSALSESQYYQIRSRLSSSNGYRGQETERWLHMWLHYSSSSSRYPLVVGSLRQTQLSSSEFCHGLIFRRSVDSHVSVDTVHPSMLRSCSLSSPRWHHLQSLSSDVDLISPIYVAKPPQSRFPAPLCDTLYLQSLLVVFVSHMDY